ncbi:hypothetical protein LTSEUGA_3995, partial [Salmonella enterica subsp. enterica serovar Uganda str. R8-3404]
MLLPTQSKTSVTKPPHHQVDGAFLMNVMQHTEHQFAPFLLLRGLRGARL